MHRSAVEKILRTFFRDTDPRLKLVEIHSAPLSPLAIIEVKLGDEGGKA